MQSKQHDYMESDVKGSWPIVHGQLAHLNAQYNTQWDLHLMARHERSKTRSLMKVMFMNKYYGWT